MGFGGFVKDSSWLTSVIQKLERMGPVSLANPGTCATISVQFFIMQFSGKIGKNDTGGAVFGDDLPFPVWQILDPPLGSDNDSSVTEWACSKLKIGQDMREGNNVPHDSFDDIQYQIQKPNRDWGKHIWPHWVAIFFFYSFRKSLQIRYWFEKNHMSKIKIKFGPDSDF